MASFRIGDGKGPDFGGLPGAGATVNLSSGSSRNLPIYFAPAPSGDATGATDPTPLNAILSYCNLHGGILVLGAGTYFVNTPLVVGQNTCVMGTGPETAVRAVGNVFCFSFNTGLNSRVTNLWVDAAAQQTSTAGAFDYTNALAYINVDNIWVGNNLFYTFNLRPNGGALGHYFIDKVHFRAVKSHSRAFIIGDGVNLITDVSIENVMGSAFSSTDMTTWMLVNNNVDTLKCHNVNFFQGGGIAIGVNATGSVTGAEFSHCLMDTAAAIGVQITKCRGMTWDHCTVQTSGTVGMQIGANVLGFEANGGVVQNNANDGIDILNGAVHTSLNAMQISDNNTSAGAFGAGVSLGSTLTDWSITNCTIGNFLLGNNNQKYGILGGAGAADRGVIVGNRFPGNLTAAYQLTNITGQNIEVRGNMPEVINTVASAATVTLPPGEIVGVSGTTGITSITAGYVGRQVILRFSNIVTVTSGSNLILNGNYTSAANGTLKLFCDGVNWYEVARTV